MFGEIAYMIVWGFFSAMGWMAANYTVDRVAPEKPKTEITQPTEKPQP